MIEQSDFLIAIWDGATHALVGGTGHTIQVALETGAPVVWIDANAPEQLAHPFRARSARRPAQGIRSGVDRSAELQALVRRALRPAAARSTRRKHGSPAGPETLARETLPARSNPLWHWYRRVEALFGADTFRARFRNLRQTYETPDAIASGSARRLGEPCARAARAGSGLRGKRRNRDPAPLRVGGRRVGQALGHLSRRHDRELPARAARDHRRHRVSAVRDLGREVAVRVVRARAARRDSRHHANRAEAPLARTLVRDAARRGVLAARADPVVARRRARAGTLAARHGDLVARVVRPPCAARRRAAARSTVTQAYLRKASRTIAARSRHPAARLPRRARPGGSLRRTTTSTSCPLSCSRSPSCRWRAISS